jgi:hypothetical protein
MTNSIETKNNKEWLEFIGFAERALGASDPIVVKIRQDNVINKKTNSVAAYYKNKLRTEATFNRDLTLKQLLKNDNFILKVLEKTRADVDEWIEVYNNADWIIKTYSNPEDNIYIKCNPVDDNEMEIGTSNNSIAPQNNTEVVLTAATNMFSPEKMFENIGLQIVIGFLFLAMAYLIGNYIFIRYPKTVIENANFKPKSANSI